MFDLNNYVATSVSWPQQAQARSDTHKHLIEA